MKYIIPFVIMFFLSKSILAQNIESMAGVRLGGTSALTYKKLFSNLEAVEIMMSGRQNGLQFTGLYEKHKPLILGMGENFFGYYGFGAHLGYVQSDPLLLRTDSLGFPQQFNVVDIRRKNFFTMGIDAIFGVEYHIYSIPMAIAFDAKPALELIGMRYLKARAFDFGISAKYIF